MNHSLHIKLLITIVNRDKGQVAVDLLAKEGIHRHYIALGRGTAKTVMLSLLGIGDSAKDIVFTLLPQDKLQHTMHRLQRAFHMHTPGSGIAFTLSLSSVANCPLLPLLLGNHQNESHIDVEKEYPMGKEETSFDLIVSIVENDTADDIMDIARGAGAPGGTVIHVRGAGTKYAEKFYGITIQPEKEMIFILAKHETKKAIMEAMQSAIEATAKGRGVVFSIAASDVTGFTQLNLEDE